jgi:hypothetical protein
MVVVVVVAVAVMVVMVVAVMINSVGRIIEQRTQNLME